MRVITFQELCAQPIGAVFSVFVPCMVEGLYRRGRILSHSGEQSLNDYYCGPYSDFYYHSLVATPNDSTMGSDDPKKQTFWNIGDGSRWGNLDPGELFVLYEPFDIETIVSLLNGQLLGGEMENEDEPTSSARMGDEPINDAADGAADCDPWP